MTEHAPRLFPDDAAVRRIGEGLIGCRLSRADWTHEAHIAACLYIVSDRGDLVPERDLPGIIRRFNESVGGVNDETQGYHETITQAYIRGVRLFLSRTDPALPLVAKVNALLVAEEGRRDWPLRFYSSGRLFSVEARLRWVEPDLNELLDASNSGHLRSPLETTPARRNNMTATIADVREHMEIIGADGVHVGTVDKVEGGRIKMTKKDSGSHTGHHHYIPGGLISGIDGNQVRLSANADNAILFEEEEGGEPLGEQSVFNWKTVGIGVAALAGVAAAAGAYVMQSRREDDESGSGKKGRKSKKG